MHVFEINYPGTWLEPHQPEVESYLLGLRIELSEAAAALNLFENELRASAEQMNHLDNHDETLKQWREDRDRHSAIEATISPDHSLDSWHQSIQKSEQANITLKKEKWAQGQPPGDYQHRQIFIYAKSFLYSLDTFQKMLDKLSDLPGVSPKLKETVDKFKQSLPDLKEVRNTSHHMEDRIVGKKYDKPILPKGSSLYLSNLEDNVFVTLKADGKIGRVEVSEISAKIAQVCLQEVVDSFTWKGRGEHYPS